MQMERFAECLTSSGLILNEDITWISFHGAYDFAYLLKILTNLPLPDNETMFLEQIQTYFPFYYDVRYLVKKDNFRGSLTKLAQGLEINRIGSQHQAGSDSIVTSEIFFRLKKINDFDEVFIKGKNVLFGLGCGCDENEANNFNQNYYANSNVNMKSVNSNQNQSNYNSFGIENNHNYNSNSNNYNQQMNNYNNSNNVNNRYNNNYSNNNNFNNYNQFIPNIGYSTNEFTQKYSK